MCKARRVSLGLPQGRARLKVAVDATPLLGRRTGIGLFCLESLGALSRRDELDLSAFAVTWRRRHLLETMVPPPVRVVRRAMPARPLHRLWARTSVPPIEWFVGSTDVVHGMNYVVPPTRAAARVVSVIDLTAVHYPQVADPATLVYPALIRRAVAEGAWVHTASHFVAGEIVAEFGVDTNRVRVVPLGIPSHDEPGHDEPGQHETGPDTPPPSAIALPDGVERYVLAVGTLEPRKDLAGLVRAFEAMAGDRPDVALVLAGSAGWGTDALSEAVAASKWRRRIVATGYLDDAVLRTVLAGAAVLAYPSVYEGFGFPPLEAMRAGVPVVCSTAGSIPEVVGDGALLAPVGDTEALAGALASVLDDGDVRR
ncbi:MAG: glycosyltransferase family 4 protein, partial [Acidimicrobiales bacterium]